MDQYEYSMSSAYTGELAGDPPDLAAGMNDDFNSCSMSWLAF